MDLNALADFALVATNGGLGKASRASGRSKATLSRRIADLEEQLGVRLIERSARGLKLTEAGQMLMDRTEGPMHEVAEAMTAAREGLSSAARALARRRRRCCSRNSRWGESAPSSARPTPRSRSRWWPRTAWSTWSRSSSTSRSDQPKPGQQPGGPMLREGPAGGRGCALACRCQSPGAVRPVPAIVAATFQPGHWNLDEGRLVLEPIPRLRLSSFLMIRDAALAGAGAP